MSDPGPHYAYVNVLNDTKGKPIGFHKTTGVLHMTAELAKAARPDHYTTVKVVVMTTKDYDALANASRVLNSM